MTAEPSNVSETLVIADVPAVAVAKKPGPESPGVWFGAAMHFQGDPYVFSYFRYDGQLLSFGLVPEPQSWAMLIAGFGLVGATMHAAGNSDHLKSSDRATSVLESSWRRPSSEPDQRLILSDFFTPRASYYRRSLMIP